MKKRLILLIPVTLLAFGLVSLALVGAGAASIEKPTGADVFAPLANPENHLQINNPAPGMDQSIPTENIAHAPSPVDQMRQEVMNAPHSPDDLDRVEFWLNQSSMSNMWGHVDPGATLTITTPREEFYAYADPGTGDWGTDAHELYPGDEVTVNASSGYSVTVTIPDPLEAHADSSLGEVWGELGGWYNQDVEVHRAWVDESVDPPLVVQTDSSGAFVATDENMPRGAIGYIRFEHTVNTTWVIYHHPYYDIVPGLRVNYGHDWVENDYEPGFTVWLTLTNSTGEVKATATGETGMIPWWGGGTGFSTGYNVLWSTWKTPDIEAGDWVYLSIENGYSNQIQLGTIEGELDYVMDTLGGNIYAPWFTQTLGGGCGVWEEGGPGMGFEFDPDGGVYSCNFGDLGWDLQPGQTIGVNYWEPDSDQVYNVFRDPVPHLWISTWGHGDAAVGGNYVLDVNYNNDGDTVAEDVIITATLLNGMTYLGDTSGVTPSGDGQPGNPLVWQLGDLPVYQYGSRAFEIFVQVTAGLSETIDHEVSIETTTSYYQGDPWSKYSYWSGTVMENNTDVNVGKGVWTWYPAPGYNFVYAVNVCGGGNTASTELTLTDNLPLSTTLVSWWAQRPGWVEVSSSDHQLVVLRPSVPAYWCGEVYLLVNLDEDAWEGMQLDNYAEIFASNDLEPSNNSAMLSHNVGSPHPNLSVWPDWVWGNFVPGGDIYYEFRYQNTGNTSAENVLLTSTLPAGTSFSFAYTMGDWGWIPITPTVVNPEYLVWDIGLLESGYYQQLGIALQIDPETEPGSLLTHTVEISPQPAEDRYDDNTFAWVERVNEPGPNLSVDKHTNWHWTWEGQLEFELRIRNLGTAPLDNVWITDTYPISTTLSNWWQGHGPWITYTHDADSNLLIMWMDYLNPGETASIAYQFDLEPEILYEQGLAFTNTVEAPIADDTNPSDNNDMVVAYTGPDVYATKRLSGGELRAGEIVTFTIEFGNQNRWPWNGDGSYNSRITDTLPAEMTFIRATHPDDPEKPWYPWIYPGNQLVWEWSPIWAETSWSFDIVAQIAEDVAGGDVLTNRIEAYGKSPDDIEPNWDNNVYELAMVIEEAPQASFTTNSPVRFGELMVFTNTSIPGYPATTTYAWDFGDGETSTDENPTHLYAAPGVYTVTLTATNDTGSSTYSQEVEVKQPLIHLPLIFKND